MKENSSVISLENKIACLIKEEDSILEEIELPINNFNAKVLLKREDLIHPTISGNKWRKLKYNLIEAKKLGATTLLTFGGAFSNHIHAVASAGKHFDFNTIGIIRGEEHLPHNPTLSDAIMNGMKIHYLNRSDYRKKNEQNIINELKLLFGDFYLIPEGGSNNLAVKGCTEIINQINIDFDILATACGTGGTISGIICGLEGNKKVLGIPVLKGADFLNNAVSEFVKKYSSITYSNWELNLDYHFGGYAKITKELVFFIREFEEINKIKLDPVYTGKLLYGIQDMIQNNKIPDNCTIIVIHTGGLQGIAGMQNKMDKLLS